MAESDMPLTVSHEDIKLFENSLISDHIRSLVSTSMFRFQNIMVRRESEWQFECNSN